MLEVGSQNMFEIWNYSLTYTSLAVMAVFVVDMIGHNTNTITTMAFSWASLAGIVVGELTMTLMELDSLPAAIPIACLATIVASANIALLLRTKDPEVENRRGSRRSKL